MSNEAVFVVVEIVDVLDEELLKTYQAGARAQVAGFGGTVIGRGVKTFEGEPQFAMLMIQKWPNEAAFRNWQESDAYRPLLQKRQRAAKLRIGIVPVFTPSP
jgi:uncharacterized protein (DUF1330 family)